MKKIAFIIMSLAMTVALFGNGEGETSGTSSQWSGSYTFGGSTTVEPIILAAAEVIQARYPGVQISYDAPGSSAGVRGALDGTYSIGAASRDLKSEEVSQGAVATPVALDGVAVVVNKASVGIDNLTMDQIIGIYAGEITNWKEVGGVDGQIVVINRDEASGTRSCFSDATMKKAKKEFDDRAIIVTGNGDMVAKVGITPFAIGYCGFGYIGRDGGTKYITVDGTAPTENNVLDGSYSISRKLNIITKGEVASDSFERFFLDYLLSAEGQEIVESKKFIKLP